MVKFIIKQLSDVAINQTADYYINKAERWLKIWIEKQKEKQKHSIIVNSIFALVSLSAIGLHQILGNNRIDTYSVYYIVLTIYSILGIYKVFSYLMDYRKFRRAYKNYIIEFMAEFRENLLEKRSMKISVREALKKVILNIYAEKYMACNFAHMALSNHKFVKKPNDIFDEVYEKCLYKLKKGLKIQIESYIISILFYMLFFMLIKEIGFKVLL